MEEKKSFLLWVKVHKKQLIIAGVSLATIVGIILGIKNRESIIRFWNSLKKAIEKTPEIRPSVNTEMAVAVASHDATQTVASIKISSDILENLTGNKLTATSLGDKVWCSAQTINKRLVSSGLAEKLPCGEYSLTEAGKLLGEHTIKTTRAGYTFSNIEWDDSVLGIIFNPDELKEIANKQQRAMEIIGSIAD
jgi:predicted transcriptional regulator